MQRDLGFRVPPAGRELRTDEADNKGQVSSLPFVFFMARPTFIIIALALALAASLWIGDSLAQGPGQGYDEAEAQVIDRMLMCPVCPAESIDQAQVPLARQMRQRVREMLAEGASRQEVLDYFADRYGQNVLASPPKSGLNLLAWILPVVIILAALAGGLFVLKAMTGRGDGAPELSGVVAQSDDGELDPYLDAVDRSLAIDGEDEKSGKD